MLAVLMRVAFFLLHHQEHWAFDNDMSTLNNDSDSCNLLLIINPPTHAEQGIRYLCVCGGGGKYFCILHVLRIRFNSACINSQQ